MMSLFVGMIAALVTVVVARAVVKCFATRLDVTTVTNASDVRAQARVRGGGNTSIAVADGGCGRVDGFVAAAAREK